MKRILVVLFCLLSPLFLSANISFSDTLVNHLSKIKQNKKSFSEIDAKIAFKEVLNSRKNTISLKNAPQFFSPKTDSLKKTIERIFTKQNLKFIENISGNTLVELPVGLKGHTTDGFEAEIVIVKAKVTESYLELTAFARLQTQFNGIKLYFAADGLKLSHEGGVIDSWKLHLIGSQSLPQLGNKMLLTFTGSEIVKATGGFVENSYIEFDCNGFKSFSFKSDIRLARSIVIPIGADGKKVEYSNDLSEDGYNAVGNNNYVGAKLDLYATGWNDMLLQVTLPKFEIKNLEGWVFNLENAVFDMSDIKNSPNVQFPDAYTNNQVFPGGNQNAWRGFYAKELKVILPKEFKENNQNNRTEFAAENLILDNLGVSGHFHGYHVLDKGSASSWQFKVDTVDVKIAINHLTFGKFTGSIKPGALSSYLSFRGLITPVKYLMAVKIDSADIKMFKGKLIFAQGSWVKMEVDKTTDRFKAEAFLNGTLNIAGDAGDEPPTGADPNSKKFVEFKGIIFQNLHLKSWEQPFIQADYFGCPSDAKLGNFPLSFSNVHLVTPIATPDVVGIAFTAKLDLMDNCGIQADVTLEVLGKFETAEFQSFKFDRIKVDDIMVNIEKSGFKLHGKVVFFENDPIYGKGLSGELDIDLLKLDIHGKAKTLFANKDFRFWFADFQIDNSGGSGKLKIERVEGGLSYRMKRTDGNMAWAYNSAIYQPDSTAGLGLRAGAKGSYSAGTTFKAKLFIELEYNNTGGMNRLYFLGEGAMMSDNSVTTGNLKDTWVTYDNLYQGSEKNELLGYLGQGNLLKIAKRAHPLSEIAKDGKIGVYVSIEKDFAHDTFDGLFELYLKLEGLKGAGANNKFGMVHLYTSPTKSYLHIGTPTDKLGAIFKLGAYDVNVNAYFMTGDVLPTQQIPPPRVLQILGPSIMQDNRNLSLLENGSGFAFGLDFSVAMNYDLGFFYAYLEAGGGFDITHMKLTGVSCAGRNGPVGNDGWYSMGQVYAYLYGEFGIRVNLWFFKADIPILQAGVAALLRGEFPNPTHMEGYVGASYNVLGGLVSGRVRFKVEIGDRCDFIGMSNAIGVAVISDVKPELDATKVDVFKIPQVAFNYPVNVPFTISNRDGNPRTIRIKLKTFELKADGQNLVGDLVWLDNNTKLNFVSDDVLPPLKNITGKVEVNFEEKSGASWVLMTENGQNSAETKQLSFTTTTAPDYVPIENIKYSYPVPNTNNFYPQQHKNVYIKLKRGQDYLFTGDNALWSIKGEVFEATQRKWQTTLAYDTASNKISFPYDNIITQKNYKLNLTAYAPGVDPNIVIVNTGQNYNVNTSTSDLNNNNSNTTIENTSTVTNAQATSGNKSNVNKSLLEYAFTTSVHPTFVSKLASINRTGNGFEIINALTHALHYLTNPYEVFNESELYGSLYTDGKPLISAEAVLDDAYYTQTIYPLLYQNYPLDGTISLTNRTPSILGLPPVRSINIPGYYQFELQNNPTSQFVNQRLPFRYNMPLAYKTDYSDLHYQVVNRFMGTPVNWAKYNQYRFFIDSSFPIIPYGNYKIKIKYLLNENEFSYNGEKIYNRNY